MKTNNRLSKDNTSVSVVKQHRPMVKVVEYEYENVYGDKEWYKQGLFPFAETTKPTTRVREVERPMNDTEYIEYLEKEIQELKDKFDKLNNQYQQEHVNELFDLNKLIELRNKITNIIDNHIDEYKSDITMNTKIDIPYVEKLLINFLLNPRRS